MYLSDRDLRWAIECGTLIVDPKPQKIDSTSIDLHLDSLDQAKVWDVEAFNADQGVGGHNDFELRIGKFDYPKFAPKFLKPPPNRSLSLSGATRSSSNPADSCSGKRGSASALRKMGPTSSASSTARVRGLARDYLFTSLRQRFTRVGRAR
jgi:hypothetical protein